MDFVSDLIPALLVTLLLAHIVARRAVRTGLYYRPTFLAIVLSFTLLLPVIAIRVYIFRRKKSTYTDELLKLRRQLTEDTANAMIKEINKEKGDPK